VWTLWGVEGPEQADDDEVLGAGSADDPRTDFASLEEPSVCSGRIVDTMFEADGGVGPAVGNFVFHCRREGFDELF
jgi:hypothetical protein